MKILGLILIGAGWVIATATRMSMGEVPNWASLPAGILIMCGITFMICG